MDFSDAELAVLDQRRPHTCSRWLLSEGNVQAFAVIDHGQRPAYASSSVSEHGDTTKVLAQACGRARAGSMGAGLLGLSRAGAAIAVVAHEALGREHVRAMLDGRLGDAGIVTVLGAGLDTPDTVLNVSGTPSPSALARARAGVLRAWLAPLPPSPRALVIGVGGAARDAAAALVEDGVQVHVWDRDPANATAAARAWGVTAAEGDWTEVDAELLVTATEDPLLDEDAAARVSSRVVVAVTPYATADTATRRRLSSADVALVPEPFGAVGDLLCLATAEGALEHGAALDRLRDDARELMTDPATARARAIDRAIARSKSSG